MSSVVVLSSAMAARGLRRVYRLRGRASKGVVVWGVETLQARLVAQWFHGGRVPAGRVVDGADHTILRATAVFLVQADQGG